MEQQVIHFYPMTAGFKARSGPSREAAEAITASSDRIATMAAICDSIKRRGPATADELAERLERDRLYIRPRVSELHTIGKLYDTGARRLNESGRPATVWGVCTRIGDTPDQPRQKPVSKPRLRLVDEETAREILDEPKATAAPRPAGILEATRALLASVFRRWW